MLAAFDSCSERSGSTSRASSTTGTERGEEMSDAASVSDFGSFSDVSAPSVASELELDVFGTPRTGSPAPRGPPSTPGVSSGEEWSEVEVDTDADTDTELLALDADEDALMSGASTPERPDSPAAREDVNGGSVIGAVAAGSASSRTQTLTEGRAPIANPFEPDSDTAMAAPSSPTPVLTVRNPGLELETNAEADADSASSSGSEYSDFGFDHRTQPPIAPALDFAMPAQSLRSRSRTLAWVEGRAESESATTNVTTQGGEPSTTSQGEEGGSDPLRGRARPLDPTAEGEVPFVGVWEAEGEGEPANPVENWRARQRLSLPDLVQRLARGEHPGLA
jgi:hypothetical protein